MCKICVFLTSRQNKDRTVGSIMGMIKRSKISAVRTNVKKAYETLRIQVGTCHRVVLQCKYLHNLRFIQTDKVPSLWCEDAAQGSECDTGEHSGHLQRYTLYICGSALSLSVQSPARWQRGG